MAKWGDDWEEQDYHFYGHAIQDEEETRAAAQFHKREVKDPGATRSLPVWKQEVTDAQGRRRFHGAFTGGYSAGYFNTAGSAEGWAPSTFRSSRGQRAGPQAQSVEQFLDEDELEEAQRAEVQATAAYDTFGSRAADAARRVAAEDARQRPSAISALLPDELVAPVADGAGIRLLQRMGWRQGKGIGSAAQPGAGAEGGGRKRGWGREAGIAADNVPLHLVRPKTDVYGLGFDPFKGAEEFRAAKQRRLGAGGPTAASAAAGRPSGGGGGREPRRRGIAFGTGALDEDDSFGELADYVMDDDVETYEPEERAGLPAGRVPRIERSGLGDRLALQGYTFEIQEADAEEDEAAQGAGRAPMKALPGTAQQFLLQSGGHGAAAAAASSLIRGFVKAVGALQRPAMFPPPKVPAGYVPVHKPQPEVPSSGLAATSPAALVPPPEDAELRQEIDQLAFFVARNGAIFENVALESQRREGRWAFLFDPGAPGAAYYRWKLQALRALMGTRQQQLQHAERAIGQRSAPLSADERGELLGEAQLPHAEPQAPASRPQETTAAAAPSQPQALARSLLNVAAADRERLQAALGSTFVRAEKEAHPAGPPPAAGLRPGFLPQPQPPPPAVSPPSQPLAAALLAAAPRIITAADLSRAAEQLPPGALPADGLPVRRVEDWWPTPLLCKRLNAPDPWHRRPQEVQATAYRADRLELPSTVAAAATVAEAAAQSAATAPQPLPPWQWREPAGPSQPLRAVAVEAQPTAQDAAGMADAFLTSMFSQPPAAQPAAAALASMPPLPGADEWGGGEGVAPPLERPLDLFKAIFQDSEEESSDEEVAATQQAAAAAAPAANAAPSQRHGDTVSRHEFGYAKLRNVAGAGGTQPTSEAGPGRPPPSKVVEEKVGGGSGSAPGGIPPAGTAAIDESVKRRVEEALRVLKNDKKSGSTKKRKKEKKEKERKHKAHKRKSFKGDEGERKSGKERSKHKHASKRSRRQRSGSEMSGSGSDSGDGESESS